MKSAFTLCLVVFISNISCNYAKNRLNIDETSASAVTLLAAGSDERPQIVGQIPLPENFKRIALQPNSFSNWIRHLPLREKNIVYLYNGKAKSNQQDNYAVIDISTGDKNLQQCADALMRLRAEYLFSVKAYEEIKFISVNGKELSFDRYAKGERYALVGERLVSQHIDAPHPCYDHECLMQFLDIVFTYCSTYSLQRMCKPKQLSEAVLPGDMFVKAGSPGHAMMVADVAVNTVTKQTIYLLLQGFMPAQDMHIVRNPSSATLSPWYNVSANHSIITPGWFFEPTEFKEW
jgi:hypothetical protein